VSYSGRAGRTIETGTGSAEDAGLGNTGSPGRNGHFIRVTAHHEEKK
jgi:hypothetical protein